MNDSFNSRGCERGSDFGDVAEMKEGDFNDMTDMGLKGEGGIKDHAKVAGLGRWEDNSAIDDESGDIDFAECRFRAYEEEFCFIAVEFEEVVLHPGFNS